MNYKEEHPFYPVWKGILQLPSVSQNLAAAYMQLEGADLGNKDLQKRGVNHTINSINNVITSLICLDFKNLSATFFLVSFSVELKFITSAFQP